MMLQSANLAIAAVLAVASCAAQSDHAGSSQPPATAQAGAPEPGPEFRPAAPAFEPGMDVIDPAGVKVGSFQTLANSPNGTAAVLTVDGVFVSVPLSKLKLDGSRIASSETKAQILAAAKVKP